MILPRFDAAICTSGLKYKKQPNTPVTIPVANTMTPMIGYVDGSDNHCLLKLLWYLFLADLIASEVVVVVVPVDRKRRCCLTTLYTFNMVYIKDNNALSFTIIIPRMKDEQCDGDELEYSFSKVVYSSECKIINTQQTSPRFQVLLYVHGSLSSENSWQNHDDSYL